MRQRILEEEWGIFNAREAHCFVGVKLMKVVGITAEFMITIPPRSF